MISPQSAQSALRIEMLCYSYFSCLRVLCDLCGEIR